MGPSKILHGKKQWGGMVLRMRYFIKTYGCQMNERDSEAAGAVLEQSGFLRAPCEEQADVIIVNTCSVRGKAEDKALGKMRLLLNGRDRVAGRIVGAMGCMVERLGRRIFDEVDGLHFAVGTRRISRLPDLVERVVRGEAGLLGLGNKRDDADTDAAHMGKNVSAFVSVLYGCNRRCAYCIVPSVRGREWSRPGKDIIAEIRNLAATGVKDVTLLGQSVMSYGAANRVWDDGYSSTHGFREAFPRLLEAAASVEGVQRVRFTSGHPSGCTEELRRAVAEIPEICEHIHLPVQSGSDRILRMMRRGYTAGEYRRVANALREAVPSVCLTTDVIVGFPSETVEEYNETRVFMQEMDFDNAFIFKYSPRPGTPAADWNDDVSAEEKMRRNKELLSEQDERGERKNMGFLGRRVEVLVEGVSPRNEKRMYGRTRENKIAVFEDTDARAGDNVLIRVASVTAQTLYGEKE